MPLFCCPQCKLDLAPQLRTGSHKAPTRDHSTDALQERLKLMQFCDRLPMIAGDVLYGGRVGQVMDFAVSTPSAQADASEFTAFVTQVMMSIKPSPQVDWQRLPPSCSFAELRASSSMHVRTAQRGAACGWPSHLIPRTDTGLMQAAAVYRSVRRHLWRTVTRGHHRCVASATKHLWWPLNGTRTSAFCPAAAAYIRWRILWECVPVATMLNARPTSAPLGLVKWLAAVAPIGPATWTSAVQRWLISEVLGRDLLTSFDTLLREERERPIDELVMWARGPAHAMAGTCWVCAGRGTVTRPAQLFVRASQPANPEGAGLPSNRPHFRWHLQALKLIQH